jgi:hypothetical protein
MRKIPNKNIFKKKKRKELEHGSDQHKVSFEENFYSGISACVKPIFHLIPSTHGYHLLNFLPLLLFPWNEYPLISSGFWLSKNEHVEGFRHLLRHIKSYWGNRKILRV